MSADRRRAISTAITDSVNGERKFTPKVVAKTAGRLNFALNGCFGKIGRAMLKPIYHRAASTKHDFLNCDLIVTL